MYGQLQVNKASVGLTPPVACCLLSPPAAVVAAIVTSAALVTRSCCSYCLLASVACDRICADVPKASRFAAAAGAASVIQTAMKQHGRQLRQGRNPDLSHMRFPVDSRDARTQ